MGLLNGLLLLGISRVEKALPEAKSGALLPLKIDTVLHFEKIEKNKRSGWHNICIFVAKTGLASTLYVTMFFYKMALSAKTYAFKERDSS